MGERVTGPRSGLQWVSLGDATSACPAVESVASAFRSWADSFLTRPSGALGRDGPVCPYTRPAMRRDLLWLAQVPETNPPKESVREIVEDAFDLYTGLPTGDSEASAVLRAMITAFPNVEDYSLIDEIQVELKTGFVDCGSMLGQFYPGCKQGGLWNKDFRPLDAPIPMLVVRSMVATDFPFLVDRPEWMDSYIRRFAPALPAHVRAVIVERLTSRSGQVPADVEHPDKSCIFSS